MDETITKRITKVNKNGFQVEGYENWFNLSKSHEDQITIPPVGTEIEFAVNRWPVPNSDKIMWFVDEIIPVTQVAAPQPAKSYDGLQQSATHAAVPTPVPVAEPPRTEPEPVSAEPGPVLGTHASTELSIQRQVALKAAIELLVGVYGGGACDEKSVEELQHLVDNVVYVADNLGYRLLLGGAQKLREVSQRIADDSLVKTPSQMAEPGPEWQGA